jgi:N6-adenosine-specific RNA methylase IME4
MKTISPSDHSRIDDGAYDVMLIDPPWQYDDTCTSGERGAGYKYGQLKTVDLSKLDVGRVMAANSVVFLWATAPMIMDAFACLKAWGFKYKTIAFCWVKASSDKVQSVPVCSGGLAGLACGESPSGSRPACIRW